MKKQQEIFKSSKIIQSSVENPLKPWSGLNILITKIIHVEF